jgi:diadenylate cyclase
MSTIAIYRHDRKHVVQPSSALLERAGQALSTLQRFRSHVDTALATLSTLEVEDAVSVRDVVAVLLPSELVHRIATEIQWYLLELGADGRLVWLQLEELTAGVVESLTLVVRDYVVTESARARAQRDGLDGGPISGASGPVGDEEADDALTRLHALSSDEILDPIKVAETLGLGASAAALDRAVEARGYRLLHRLPRFSDALIDRIVERFATLSRIMGASIGDLEEVGGVGEAKARSVKDGLARLAEASILERYG